MRTRAASLCLWVLPALLFTLSGCASSKGPGSGQTFRVLTFNIRHREGAERKIEIERIARTVLESKADLVALQEVGRGLERTKTIDDITTLADLTGMTYAFGKTGDVEGGDRGNGALTRVPIYEERNVLFQSGRQGVLELVVGVGGQEIVFMSTQLSSASGDSERIGNAGQLCREAKNHGGRPVLICGDFSEAPSGRATSLVREDFSDCWTSIAHGDGFTFPSARPSDRVDYVFASKNKSDAGSSLWLRPVSGMVLRNDASDHLPVLFEFELTSHQ